jgi:hypothetical protein
MVLFVLDSMNRLASGGETYQTYEYNKTRKHRQLRRIRTIQAHTCTMIATTTETHRGVSCRIVGFGLVLCSSSSVHGHRQARLFRGACRKSGGACLNCKLSVGVSANEHQSGVGSCFLTTCR